MNSGRQTFKKSERLCSTKIIADLFDKGNQFYTPHFRVLWEIACLRQPFPVQVAFSVTKRSFRAAVTRNLLKRRIREAYRKNKHSLCEYFETKNTGLLLMLIFRKNEIPDYQTVEQAIKVVLSRLIVLLKERE